MAASMRILAVAAVAHVFLAWPGPTVAQRAVDDEDLRIARSLATMLQSARTVISDNQDRINDPDRGDKGLTGDRVLEQAIDNYRDSTGRDPRDIDPDSLEGRLLGAQMDSVVEVMENNQELINAEDMGFKGFIPATFARLVTEAFGRHVGDEARMKVTAPPDLVRNRQARPDDWETRAISEYLRARDWPRGQIYSGTQKDDDGTWARVMVPEYYAESCLTCHGKPEGEKDVTGYPKEGASQGDLGGIISIRLLEQ